MTDCLALSQHLRFYLKARTMSCKMEELQFLDTSEMWSMCGQNDWERDSHLLDLRTFYLFWLFVKRCPLCVFMHFSFDWPG